ncbi:40S ribosomal protein S5-1 [Hordeum vulgare]|nr:40S ribosomal protein S5-1 [Hordeum vulgare]
MQHPQAIHMREGVLHIRDVQGPKGTGSVEARLEAMEKEVFRCKGRVERGLNANHLMIIDYTRDLKVDGKSMKDIVFSLNEQINFLHSQIHDLQSQVFEYETRFKGAAGAIGVHEELVRVCPRDEATSGDEGAAGAATRRLGSQATEGVL